jgi:hypothetical protein
MVIMVSLIILHYLVTSTNALNMKMAILRVFLYHKTKMMQTSKPGGSFFPLSQLT